MGLIRTPRMRQLTAVWVSGVLRHRWLTLAGFVLLSSLGFGYARGHLGIDTDTTDMISASLPWRQDYIAYRNAFPNRDRTLLVVIESPIAEAAEIYASDLAARLEAYPDLYPSIFLPAGDAFFERNGLLYLSVPELYELSDRLAAVQPLLGRLQSQMGGAALVQTLAEAQFRASGDALGLDRMSTALARAFAAASTGGRGVVSWGALLRDDTVPVQRQFLLIQPQLDTSRALPAGPAIERLRLEIAALADEPIADLVRARVTGTVAMEHEELMSVSRGAGLAGLAALLLVTLVLWVALRSFKLLLLALIALVLGLICTAGFAALSVGHLNLLSVAFAVLYVGLGVDFILHIALRLRELNPAEGRLDPALIEGIGSVGPALMICAVTTAAGFYSFVPTPFQGVSELGLIAGTGMLISLFTSLTLYPALLGICARAQDFKPLSPLWGSRLGHWLLARPRGVIAGSAALGLAALVSLPRVVFDNNPVHLRDPDSESVATLRDLAADAAALPMDLVAMAPEAAVAADWAQALSVLDQVREVRRLESWVPEDQARKLAILADLALLLGPDFAAVTPANPDPARLETALSELERGLGAIAQPSSAQQLLAEQLGALRGRLAQLSAPAAAQLLRDLDRDLTEFLPRQLERLDRGLNAAGVSAADLPARLRARWVAPGGQTLLEISPRENTYGNAAAERFVRAVREVVPRVTGLPVVHQEASATVIRAFQQAFAYALIMILIILWLFELKFVDAALILGPVLLAAAVTGGATVWLGIDFNFANIIALPLLLGVGVDNGIHVVHRARHEALRDAHELHNSTSRAVLASGLTTIASFGNLAFSSHLGMASMGQLLTLGMIAALAASLVLLPALLLVVRRA